MALPILVVVFMLAFIGAIIEYPVASVLLSQQDQLTLAVGSKLFVQEHNFHWGDFAAAAILSGLPITAVFLLAQRWLIAGLAAQDRVAPPSKAVIWKQSVSGPVAGTAAFH